MKAFPRREISLKVVSVTVCIVLSGCQNLPGNLAYSLGIGDEKVMSCDENGANCRARTMKERADEEWERHQKKQQQMELQKREREARSAALEAKRREEQQRLVEARRRQVAEDEANGYKYMAVSDIHLDQKLITPGTKIAVNGFYRSSGRSPNQYETLVSTFLPNALEVILITDRASRAAREQMLKCRSFPDARSAVCPMTVLGRASKCNVTFLGNRVSTDFCLAVDTARSNPQMLQ